MINDFLVISCTGKNNLIGLKTNNKFFKEKITKQILTQITCLLAIF